MEKKEVLQWHPAFFAGIQIELEEEREYPVSYTHLTLPTT